MIDEKYYNISKENLTKSDFWTNKLYNNAYEKVKNRKYPLVIPSYNRPNSIMMKYIHDNTDFNEPWDIYFVVRKSQIHDYEENIYFKEMPFVKLLSFEDHLIDDAGKVRMKIIEFFNDKEEALIFMDDDITNLTYTVPFRRDSGANISLAVSQKFAKINFARILAMWQIAMEKAIELNDKLIISCPMIAGFSWAEDYCDSEISIKYMSGAQVACFCINLKNCKTYDINFRTNVGNGHEDKDFVIRSILAGCATAEFRWLAYSCSSMGTDYLNLSVKERMEKQHDEMYNNFHDLDFVKFIIDRNNFKNVRINWNKATKYYNKINGTDINRKNNTRDLSKILNL